MENQELFELIQKLEEMDVKGVEIKGLDKNDMAVMKIMNLDDNTKLSIKGLINGDKKVLVTEIKNFKDQYFSLLLCKKYSSNLVINLIQRENIDFFLTKENVVEILKVTSLQPSVFRPILDLDIGILFAKRDINLHKKGAYQLNITFHLPPTMLFDEKFIWGIKDEMEYLEKFRNQNKIRDMLEIYDNLKKKERETKLVNDFECIEKNDTQRMKKKI